MTNQALPLFYEKPRPLRSDSDQNRSLSTVANFNFAATASAVPLIATELPVVCRHFPILFAAADRPIPVALLGLRPNENLFVEPDGRWADGAYIPAYVRRYPFIFMESGDGAEFTLCIDEAATAVVSGRKNPFFDKAGKPTAVTENALAFCRDYQAIHVATTEFVNALVKADLLVANRADVTLASGEKLTLDGFNIIDEARFNQLPDAEFLNWRAKGWLPLVYYHFISIGNWQALIDRTATRAKAG